MTIETTVRSTGKGRPIVAVATAIASVTSCANLEGKIPILVVLSKNTIRKGFKCNLMI